MKISEQNILNRWNLMKDCDLGSDVNYKTEGFYNIFKNVIEYGKTQIDIRNMNDILPMLRGIILYYNLEPEIHIVDLYDLHYINITLEGVKELDSILMNDFGYDEKYLFCNPPKLKKRRNRR